MRTFYIIGILIPLPLPFVLANGVARELLSEQGGWIALRLLAQLLIGFGYVALFVFVRECLQEQPDS